MNWHLICLLGIIFYFRAAIFAFHIALFPNRASSAINSHRRWMSSTSSSLAPFKSSPSTAPAKVVSITRSAGARESKGCITTFMNSAMAASGTYRTT